MRSAIKPTMTTIADLAMNDIIMKKPFAAEGLFLACSCTRASMTGVVERIVNPEKSSAR
ncbi:MAG: hypothetical protein KJ550_00230 [Proteobacteria bacterium]|nr:hypothetical protein [Pseudomonadota bacterium]MBU4067075.1 hypothetical protein [Pseudomonadota bacterium]MBU4100842.1 hypothetical protein [Pseudomonadota bacterium]